MLISGSNLQSPPQGPPVADSPTQLSLSAPAKKNHRSNHLTVDVGIGLAVTAFAIVMLPILIVLIRRKKRELEGTDEDYETPRKSIPLPTRKFQDGNFFYFFSSLL